MDLLIVFIGLAMILFLFSWLGTARMAIKKGYQGLLWVIIGLIPILPFVMMLLLPKKPAEKTKLGFVENIINDLTQPFIDLAHTSRALFGLNLSYVLEGLTYFGVVTLLAIFFNEFIKLNDIDAGRMVGFLTGGITLAMLFLGATVDWVGVRKALLIALSTMLVGRIFLTISPQTGETGLWGTAHIFSMLGLLGIILGYGIYQPACYAAVKKFTTEKTSAMGYAMLYALMNLGGFLPGLISPPVRRAFGITGVYWVYVALTAVGIVVVWTIMSKKAVKLAIQGASADVKDKIKKEEDEMGGMTFKEKVKYYIKNFPLRDRRFMFFIFILIFVQTLFAHNWLTLPQYASRAFEGFVQDNYEFFVNLNPILIFILTPMVTALTSKKNAYTMMIIGTFVMASPTFILALGPSMNTLL
ncbi:MAG: MFS transporter, partial [Ignavibacteria bacterium RBG_13_36_8]